MSYIFMDESGCLGFDFSKKKTTKYFVVTFLFCSNKRPLEKIIRKTFQGFAPRIRKIHSGTLHCHQEKPATRIKLLNELAKLDNIAIMSIRLNKEKVYAPLQDEKAVLYNYITNILLDRIYTRKLIPLDGPIHLIASKRETNKFLNKNFKSYLERQASQNHSVRLNITITPSYGDKGLQIVDFASWSIFRAYEHQDFEYYDIIRQKIIEDKSLFQ